MAGLVPAIPLRRARPCLPKRDHRDEPGDDLPLLPAASVISPPEPSPSFFCGSFVRLLIGTLFALAVAAFVGLGLTYYALSRGAAFGGLSIDSWDAYPKTGTVEADPYARASIARSGRLPIALGDGVSFTVQEDDDGKVLDGRCDVVLSGITPVARYWTLTLYNPDGGAGRQFGRPLRLHQRGNRAQGRRHVRSGGGPARQCGQLAADRRRRALRADLAALRHRGRRLDQGGARSPDAGGVDQELPGEGPVMECALLASHASHRHGRACPGDHALRSRAPVSVSVALSEVAGTRATPCHTAITP